MKILRTLLILTLLIGFPVLSWYYLTGGIDYRKQALKELKNRMDLPDVALKILGDTLMGQVTLINLSGGQESYLKVNQQFEKVDEFSSLDLTTDLDSTHQILKQSLASAYEGKAYLVLDDSLQLRYTYVDNIEDMKLLVKHIATLLPFDIKKKEKK